MASYLVWAGRDGDDLVFSTVEGRVKHRSMLRDPHACVTVIDSADPENYVELRGGVSMTPDIGRRLCQHFSGVAVLLIMDESRVAVG